MMTPQNKTIAEANNFIVLDKYEKPAEQPSMGYQSEADLEREFINDLVNQGYEYLPNVTTPETLLANAKEQIEELNDIFFTNEEWERFLVEYLDKPNDTLIEKTKKIQEDYIKDFVFGNNKLKNIYLVDKEQIARNKVQVISQFEQSGTHKNRYDVTILVNGLPLVQIELKKRGVPIREAFNQIHRYSKESFNSEHSLYKYVQIFVISNGTDTRYFANTLKREANSFDFTMNWADAKNNLVKDLKYFTATFFQKNTLLSILLTYSVFNVDNELLIMRPYQIAATERILWKIQCSHNSNIISCPEAGGYIWHATGSGKTLTSFKAARLATQLDFIDKVFFVVDRKDLDYQTMKEYQRFSPDSVNGSNSTAELKRNIDKDDNKIIVTTIQKLHRLLTSNDKLPIYEKQVVFIFDEAHRSQFGEEQRLITKKFKKYYQFGFTGTPIFKENALKGYTTEQVFGKMLHSYVITNAIRDEKVLKFKVDYNDTRPKFKENENEKDESKLIAAETDKVFLHPERITAVSKYILDNFNFKTHRNTIGGKANGFNAMFAVSSVKAAKCYYEELNRLQKDSKTPLKIATIFSFAANEEQNAIGEIEEENFEPSAMNTSSKEFLEKAIKDYNAMFGTSYSVEGDNFQNYYKDLAQKVKNRDIDLVIVVGMFLTGFDAPQLNTLFVDKNLRYHGLIQAFSRTNRIFDKTKSFGNIVTFRNLEQQTIQALSLFGDEKEAITVIERSFDDYLDGFEDEKGKWHRGYKEIVKELNDKFPQTDSINESNKKEFAILFGEYLRMENILWNYDEFQTIKAIKCIDINNAEAVAKFKEHYFVTDEILENMNQMVIIPERRVQDYKSTYYDMQRQKGESKDSSNDWMNDIVFEVELLKSQEITLDYILELVLEHKERRNKDKSSVIEEIERVIRASVDNRAKESLVVNFIKQTDLDNIKNKETILELFYKYAQEVQKKEAMELIKSENLKEKEAKYYMKYSLEKEKASDNGMDFSNIFQQCSPLNKSCRDKRKKVFQDMVAFVDKFKGIGGNL